MSHVEPMLSMRAPHLISSSTFDEHILIQPIQVHWLVSLNSIRVQQLDVLSLKDKLERRVKSFWRKLRRESVDTISTVPRAIKKPLRLTWP